MMKRDGNKSFRSGGVWCLNMVCICGARHMLKIKRTDPKDLPIEVRKKGWRITKRIGEKLTHGECPDCLRKEGSHGEQEAQGTTVC